VAVFGQLEALAKHIPEIATEYSRRIGQMPDVFEGTSPGASNSGRGATLSLARRAGNDSQL
jgi:galactokinase